MKNKNDDRHLGKRENIWFPFAEHKAMLDCMSQQHETNKSTFIRSAVSNYIKAIDEANKQEDK